MWLKKLDTKEIDVAFMPRSMDPLAKGSNKYDNMVEDEEEFTPHEVVTLPPSGLLDNTATASVME